jgi:hypothetical protein
MYDKVTTWLVIGTCSIALAMSVASLDFKSERSTGSSAWVNGAKPWMLLGLFGGLLIAILLVAGHHYGYRSIASTAAITIFASTSRSAESYRAQLIDSFERHSYYTDQNLASGLTTVPFISTIGVTLSALLLAISLFERWFTRHAASGRDASPHHTT